MNDTTADWISILNPSTLNALEISGDQWSSFPWKSYRSVGLPEFDIVYNTLGDARFEIIIVEQVLEHVKYPHRAVRNIYRMLVPGGYALVTLPFLVKVHNNPIDCSRWTEGGLVYFLEEAGFDPAAIRTGSWGNRACLVANLDAFVHYQPGIHSLENEPEFPVVVWALARRKFTG
jgi:SAM-dependent methyltransferase